MAAYTAEKTKHKNYCEQLAHRDT